jgi:small subunit ribosomal protein S6
VSRDYELGFILNPEVSEDEIRSSLDRIEQIIANYGGQIFKVNHWGRRRLAYPIDRHRDGYYIFIDMNVTPETVTEIERTLRVSEKVFRHMMKRRDPKTVQKEREARVAAAAQAEAAAAAQAEAAAAAQAEAAAAAQAEAANQPEAPATPVETATSVEIPVTPAEIESPATTPTESKPEAEEVAPIAIAEESVAPSPEEIESAPPAIEVDAEKPATIEA